MGNRSKYSGTVQRRKQIIQAALTCFSVNGFAGTTMADVKKLSKASHGSIYHHFKSKEHLAVAVYLEGIAEYQSGMVQALEGRKSAKQGIHALIQQHFSWIEQNTDWARYLFQMRHAAFMKESEIALNRQNKEWISRLLPWFLRHIQAGVIHKMTQELYGAFLLGPCQEITRLWLAGAVSTDIKILSKELADTVWRALRVTEKRGLKHERTRKNK